MIMCRELKTTKLMFLDGVRWGVGLFTGKGLDLGRRVEVSCKGEFTCLCNVLLSYHVGAHFCFTCDVQLLGLLSPPKAPQSPRPHTSDVVFSPLQVEVESSSLVYFYVHALNQICRRLHRDIISRAL